jgi:hypothetical protein
MWVIAALLAKGEPTPLLSPLTYAILNGLLVFGGILILVIAFRIISKQRR